MKCMCKKEISIEGHAFGKKNMIMEKKGELTWIKLYVGDLNENATYYCIERVGITLIFLWREFVEKRILKRLIRSVNF